MAVLARRRRGGVGIPRFARSESAPGQCRLAAGLRNWRGVRTFNLNAQAIRAESPRWLVTHCRSEEAEETVNRIEADVVKYTGRDLPPAHGRLEVHPRKVFGLGLILTAMLGRYRQRSILALVLMVAQSFLYNSVFFTFGLIIANFYHVPNEQVGLYLFPLAIGNFCRTAVAGSLFDTVGRKKMIAGSFAMSGVLLLVTAYMFGAGLLSATTQTIAWCIIFLFASAAASSAYLTASEIFPLETRALAIACSTRSAPPLAAVLRPSYSAG